MNFGIVFDRTDTGSLKRVKGEFFRFALRLKEADGTIVVAIEGFRYDDSMDKLLMPMSMGRWGSISIISLNDDFVAEVRARVKTAIEKEAGPS